MPSEEFFNFAKASDLKLLKALIPLFRGFAIVYREDGVVGERIGHIPRHFPQDLKSIQKYLSAHPTIEIATDTEIAIGEYDRFVVHVLDGHLICSYPIAALLIAMPSDLHVERLLSALPTGIIKLDNHWQATYSNEYAQLMLGMSNDEIYGRGWLNSIEETLIDDTISYFQNLENMGQPYKAEVQLVTPMGFKRILAIQLSVAQNFNSSVNEYYLAFQDVTNEHSANQKAKYLSSHDSLTGLKNRSYLLQKIEETILQDNILESALIYIDLNDFKMVNDTYGHEAGDQVLKVAAKRLNNAVRERDVVARIGGDEFVLFLKNVSEEALLKTVAAKIQRALNQPIVINEDVTIDLISSFGLSHGAAISLIMDDKHDINIDNWLRSADIAMYTSKEKHDGSYEVFDESFHKAKLDEKDQFQAIKSFVDNDSVTMYFQPIVRKNRVQSVELLARFLGSKRKMSPEQVIHVAKKHNYHTKLFDYLFYAGLRAYRDLLTQIKDQRNLPKLNINVDIDMLSNKDFVSKCASQVTELQLDCSTIYLEITEKVLETEVSTIKSNIEQLKKLGFKLSMDDFGTGYSSIRRLMEYNFDQIKIDRSLISGAPNSKQLSAVLKATVKLGQSLELEVLGEGVETKEELRLLQKLKVDLIQGYYFSKPENIDIITTYIKQYHHN